MLVNGTLMTVIGVSEKGFKGTTLGVGPQVYAPLSMREELTPGWKGLSERRSYWAYVFERLKPGVSREPAMNAQHLGVIPQVELPLQKGSSDQYKKLFSEQKMTLAPGEQGQSGMMRTAKAPLTMMFAITGFVLSIACANIANLLLARSANRAKKFSIRLWLGATRGQVIGQLLIEAMVLAVLAGFAGLLVAYGTARAIRSFFDQGSMSDVVNLGLRPISLVFAMGSSILAGFLFGLFPAIHSAKQDLSGAMKDQAGNDTDTSSMFNEVGPGFFKMLRIAIVEDLKTLAGQVNDNIKLDQMISTLAAAFAVWRWRCRWRRAICRHSGRCGLSR